MAGWIISVCGVALLTVLCDVIMPDGNSKKYVRTVIGVVISFSILIPLVNFLREIPLEQSSLQGSITVQKDFVNGLEEQKRLAKLQGIKSMLDEYGVQESVVTLQNNGYILVEVTCSQSTLVKLQQNLAVLDNKIAILWSDVSG